MSNVAERNFTNFYLGDNVYELADGLIPEVAERLDVQVATEPNRSDLQAIMDKVGPNKILRHNAEITAMTREEMADLVVRGGNQSALNRSLHTPDITATPDTTDAVVFVTCTANWQDEAVAVAPKELKDKPTYAIGGERPMDTATEVVNPNVERIHKLFGRLPKEAEYQGGIVVPKLVEVGFNVLPSSYPTKSGDEILISFFRDNPHLLEKAITVVRNANAGLITGVQLRDAARKFNSDFDSNPEHPQVLVVTADKPLAYNEQEEKDSRQYQKVGPALRQTVLTAKKLHEAAGGE